MVIQSQDRYHWAFSLTRDPVEYPTKPPKCMCCNSFRDYDTTDCHRQIRTSAFPSKRLPIWHSVPLYLERRGGLEAGHNDKANSPRYSRPTRRSESRFPGSSGGVQPLQERPAGIREEGQAYCEGESRAIVGAYCNYPKRDFDHDRLAVTCYLQPTIFLSRQHLISV